LRYDEIWIVSRISPIGRTKCLCPSGSRHLLPFNTRISACGIYKVDVFGDDTACAVGCDRRALLLAVAFSSYRLHVKIIVRKSGSNAVASAAYRSGSRLHDGRLSV